MAKDAMSHADEGVTCFLPTSAMLPVHVLEPALRLPAVELVICTTNSSLVSSRTAVHVQQMFVYCCWRDQHSRLRWTSQQVFRSGLVFSRMNSQRCPGDISMLLNWILYVKKIDIH